MRTLIALLVMMLPALAQPMPIPKQPGQQCPSNFRESAGFCVPISDKAAPAIERKNGCPSGWMSSGGACIKIGGGR